MSSLNPTDPKTDAQEAKVNSLPRNADGSLSGVSANIVILPDGSCVGLGSLMVPYFRISEVQNHVAPLPVGVVSTDPDAPKPTGFIFILNEAHIPVEYVPVI